MRTLRLLLMLVLSSAVSACVSPFFHQQRQFIVEGEQTLSPQELRSMFDAFKTYVREQQGRVAFFESNSGSKVSVSFRTHRIGYGPESELLYGTDRMDLTYEDGKNFVVSVFRQTYLRDPFTEEGLAKFAADTEASLQAATGKRVHLRPLPGGT